VIKETIHAEFEDCHEASTYVAVRSRLRELGGAAALRAELEALRVVESGKLCREGLTTSEEPFDVSSHVVLQQRMTAEIANLGAYADRFIISCEPPDSDAHWSSNEAERVGKAMLQHHRVMLVRDPSWDFFNVAAFGLESAKRLIAAVEMLEAMEDAALTYASKMLGWSSNVGLYFHVYGHTSVNALQLHIVDLNFQGESHDSLSNKNLPLGAILEVLRAEVEIAVDGISSIAAVAAAPLAAHPPPPLSAHSPLPLPTTAAVPLQVTGAAASTPAVCPSLPFTGAALPGAAPVQPSATNALAERVHVEAVAKPSATPDVMIATSGCGSMITTTGCRSLVGMLTKDDLQVAASLRSRITEFDEEEWEEERAETLRTLDVDMEHISVLGRASLSATDFERFLQVRTDEFDANKAFSDGAKTKERQHVLQKLEAIIRVEYAQPNATAIRNH